MKKKNNNFTSANHRTHHDSQSHDSVYYNNLILSYKVIFERLFATVRVYQLYGISQLNTVYWRVGYVSNLIRRY